MWILFRVESHGLDVGTQYVAETCPSGRSTELAGGQRTILFRKPFISLRPWTRNEPVAFQVEAAPGRVAPNRV
jgi:hypothetical protein